MRAGSVKVAYSSAAVVRNSSLAETVVVLTLEVLLEAVVGAAAAAASEAWRWVGVRQPEEGLLEGACWMSFPCSLTRAGPSLAKMVRSWGTRVERTRSFTGCLEEDSEKMSMSN